MKSTVNTFIRIVAWACVVFGVLFTILKAWLVGLPLLALGLLGVSLTSASRASKVKGDAWDSSESTSTILDKNDPSSPYFIADDADAANPFFRSVGDRIDDPVR